MASRAELEAALIKADEAGNTEDAKELALMLKNKEWDREESFLPKNKEEAIGRVKEGVSDYLKMKSNFPKSAYNLGKQFVQGTLGMVESAGNLTPAGLLINTLKGQPEKTEQTVQAILDAPKTIPESVMNYISRRYFGEDEYGRSNFKNTLINDPAGVAADFSVVGGARNLAREALLSRQHKKLTEDYIKNKVEEAIPFSSSKSKQIKDDSTQAVLDENLDLLDPNTPSIINDRVGRLSDELNSKIAEAEFMYGQKTKTGKGISVYTKNSPSKDGYFFQDGKIYVDSKTIAEVALKPLMEKLNRPTSDGAIKRNQVKKEIKSFAEEAKRYGNGRYLTLQQLQDYKKSLYADLGDAAYKKKTNTQKEAKKLLANAGKEAIEQVVPQAADLNRRMSNLLTLKNQGKAENLINLLNKQKDGSITKLFHSMLTRSGLGAMVGGLLGVPKLGTGAGLASSLIKPDISSGMKLKQAMDLRRIQQQAANRSFDKLTPQFAGLYVTSGLLDGEE